MMTVAGLARAARGLLSGTASWRVVAVVLAAVVTAVLMWTLVIPRARRANWRWRREGLSDERPPPDVRNEVRRACRNGASLDDIWKSKWDKYDKDVLLDACKKGRGYNVDQRDKNKEVKPEDCKYGRVCPNPVLRGVKPCLNKEGTKCCLKNGKSCEDAKIADKIWNVTKFTKNKEARDNAKKAKEAREKKADADTPAIGNKPPGGVEIRKAEGSDMYDMNPMEPGKVHNMWTGDWDDKIATVKVPAGKKVILYSNPDGGGDQLKLGKGNHDLADYKTSTGGNWRNIASSYKYGGNSLFITATKTGVQTGVSGTSASSSIGNPIQDDRTQNMNANHAAHVAKNDGYRKKYNEQVANAKAEVLQAARDAGAQDLQEGRLTAALPPLALESGYTGSGVYTQDGVTGFVDTAGKWNPDGNAIKCGLKGEARDGCPFGKKCSNWNDQECMACNDGNGVEYQCWQ